MFAKNPVLIFVTLGSATEGLLTTGFATFLPKYVQTIFGVTPATAALYTGMSEVPSIKNEICQLLNLLLRSQKYGSLFDFFCTFNLLGFITIPAAAAGSLFGGLVCRCFKLRVRGMFRFILMLTTCSALLCFLFLARCRPGPFAGVTVDYFSTG